MKAYNWRITKSIAYSVKLLSKQRTKRVLKINIHKTYRVRCKGGTFISTRKYKYIKHATDMNIIKSEFSLCKFTINLEARVI